MKLVVSAAAAVTAIALCAPAATAAPLRHTQESSLCGTAKAVAKYLGTALKLDSTGVVAATPANLKLAYTTVVHNEKAMLGGAPASLKPSLAATFSFVNLVEADFAKAGWQVKNMQPYFPALVAKGKAVGKQIAVVRAYLRGTCHVPI